MQQSGSGDSALEQLFHLLEDWRSLTHTETSLIRSGEWERLEELQQKKAQLQVLIETSEMAWLNAKTTTTEAKSNGKIKLRETASDLLVLERKNRELLSEQLSRIDSELKSSSKTISSLRNVQHAYAKAGPSFWQAYS
jgi:hypothetical protein